jgi:predicted alpha/beta-hydrolase family hydrolase
VSAPQPLVILLAPGAGAGSDSPWMRAWRDRLQSLVTNGGAVETMDYPYRRAGRKAPDKLPVLIASHREALAAARARGPADARVVLVGKSMGGRVGCHVALIEAVDAVICLGYPLRGAGGGALRDEVLLALRVPVLFVQGTRDPLCPLDLLADVRARMVAPNELLVVEGGNHSLEVPRGVGRGAGQTKIGSRGRKPVSTNASDGTPPVTPQQQSDTIVLDGVSAFLGRLP